VYAQVLPTAHGLHWSNTKHLLGPRHPSAHKGDCGHVLVIGGNHGMLGAARLAAEAALRTGAGLVSLATRPEHAIAIAAIRPEIMAHGIVHAHELKPLLKNATVIALGPGLGQDTWAQGLLGAVLESRLPLVVDADALNLLAQEPQQRDHWVLTPHPGEAGRLLRRPASEIQADRLQAVKALQAALGGVVVLKGVGSMVFDGQDTGICTGGNPGMASGGMGDLLTGLIAALVGQGMNLTQAAQLGVCLHAEAADRAAEQGQRGLLASDLFPVIRGLVG
jgi:NAD(P)H-hydrate epimerase